MLISHSGEAILFICGIYILSVPLQLIRHRKDDEGEPDTGEGDDVRRSEAFTEVEDCQE